MRDIPISDDFPPGFYEEVGRLVIAFGRLEYLIKLCFKDLHGNGFTIGMAEAEYDAQSTDDMRCEGSKWLYRLRPNIDSPSRFHRYWWDWQRAASRGGTCTRGLRISRPKRLDDCRFSFESTGAPASDNEYSASQTRAGYGVPEETISQWRRAITWVAAPR